MSVKAEVRQILASLKGVTNDVDRRGQIGFQSNRYALYLEAVTQCQIDELDVKREPLYSLQSEQRLRDVAPKAFQSALGVEKPPGYERRSKVGKHTGGQASYYWQVSDIAGLREVAVADNHVELPAADQRFDQKYR